jgi:hypothetical protein
MEKGQTEVALAPEATLDPGSNVNVHVSQRVSLYLVVSTIFVG